ncbi:TniB family NTP-binding protein, partial [Altererythrobacter sp. MTPC7]|uniref:TniB family NTP-binding protein n=1 Tax=Altererythrobacter sp. MTPC7 TaxID=3056567 RepID=UPI0036F1D596
TKHYERKDANMTDPTQQIANDTDKSRHEGDQMHPADLLTMRAQREHAVKEDAETSDASRPAGSNAGPIALAAAFEGYRKSEKRTRSGKVALMLARCRNIILPYPRHIDGFAQLDELRLFGLERHGQPQLGMVFLDPSGTGKTTLATQYGALLASEAEEGQLPAIHAGLGVGGTASELYLSILSALGDDVAAGSLNTLRRRAFDALRDARTEILFIDETQIGGKKSGIDTEILAEVKIMLDDGLMPIVLLGTRGALDQVRKDTELVRRMFSPGNLAPLDWSQDEDREIWTQFLAHFDREMVAQGIVEKEAGFADKNLAEQLCILCEGIIGQFTRLILMALREVIRDGRTRIELDDLALAGDEWSLREDAGNTNPLWTLVDGGAIEDENIVDDDEEGTSFPDEVSTSI